MNMTDLAPVVIFTYNRPWHTQQTLEALQKNQLANESELFIYSDFNEPNLFSQVSEDVEIPPPLKTFPLVNFDKVYETC